MTIQKPTRTAVVELATDEDTAVELLEQLDSLLKSNVLEAAGLNTRTGELEVVHKNSNLNDTDPTPQNADSRVERIKTAFEDIDIHVRLMTWSPEQIVSALVDHVGRDVRNGWYEDDEWCSATRDYCHAVYYLDGEHSEILSEFQQRC